MRTSIAVTNFSWPGERPIENELARTAALADESGIDTMFLSDHLVQAEPGVDPGEPMLEAYTALGYLAARTRRVRLGTMVTAVTMRPPALLVKAVTTLDVLSAGRAWLGVGAGYHQEEADGQGLRLPPTAERFEWLEDTLELARRVWSGDETAFDGRRFSAAHPISSPSPCTSPHPPILVGGTGETKTLRLVARYGDACNLPDMPDGGELIRRKLSVLAAHCAAEGRSLDQLDKTVSTRLQPGQSIDAFVDRAGALGELGIDHLVVHTQGPWTSASMATLATAVPDIAQIPTTTG
jgi:alkanesulfonate monooxygenase SsuD/methylene tetrahydromethanopterin reductase-like flavin-dependent oxidoreductase (luciferase family)